ncbi:substrate-binding domain-containing protein [Clostridium chauvoei]|uniref:Substrate-binding domain-containing protein n=2 Tax=Clostridium chauvoei TaxID=46867 RepID=A0ABD4REI9_9CLOT|nr:substrate-binding domain-containing protein [Clostridium chauvoei]ATD55251.1 LacI family transcriptional regulator [Clostridium chauvoei]ATD57078.1 LacI family transcriptional regulator [Clostridium chauvoei]MBX7279596.1 substrate-binding domain-containing protein [Clostridium chauvoei]MBX7281965.1 substrate-binding domain-containing protein [Clostridium chauvoei]MBX7284446.1 substrate-binding domain-containing protein [Clostridium chauvoei]
MKRKKKQILIIIFLLLMLSLLFFISGILFKGKDVEGYNISIIVRGKNSESWMIMKQGMEQAASEMNTNIRFITLTDENNLNEQKDLIEREATEGADAIIISPVDYEKMKEAIENTIKDIPVILIESTIYSDKEIPYISCDNYKLGKSLAEELIQRGNTRSRVTVMKKDLQCSSIMERYKGFIDTIKESKNTYDLLDIEGGDQSVYDKSKDIIENNKSDVIVTFDPDALELVGKAKKDLGYSKKEGINVEIYGAGSTSKVISFLEEDIINAVAVQNDFNIGYLGVKTAVDKIKGNRGEEKIINSTVINSRNMYSDENQRLLFPFIR